ncbi:hypothetical protein [Sphingomonas melonis]|uniref:hypothetical protein n=1 Tax=Sphingomonas melonis TaxID=152682 RepID=UPI00368436B8
MIDVPIESAVLLFDSGLNGETPRAAVRPLGHDDYYRYSHQVGACFTDFRKLDTRGQKLQLLVEAWHAAAFYGVPVALLNEALMAVPEYRDMLADNCLPKQFRGDRESF